MRRARSVDGRLSTYNARAAQNWDRRLAHTCVASRRGARSASHRVMQALTGDARLEFLRNSGPAPEMRER